MLDRRSRNPLDQGLPTAARWAATCGAWAGGAFFLWLADFFTARTEIQEHQTAEKLQNFGQRLYYLLVLLRLLR